MIRDYQMPRPLPDSKGREIFRRTLVVLAVAGLALVSNACANVDTDHKLLISVVDQKMVLLEKDVPVAKYPVSTSKFGLGDNPGSNATPLGRLEVARKIGEGAPAGAVFKDRRRTGEVLAPNAPGRDPIVTRILWLRGLEADNGRAFNRHIYIHGTPEEKLIGKPASYGCIRMRSRDVIELYDIVGYGAQVEISDRPIRELLREHERQIELASAEP